MMLEIVHCLTYISYKPYMIFRLWFYSHLQVTGCHYKSLNWFFIFVLWRIGPLLRGDSVNNSRCYGAPAAYACAVTSHNNIRDDAVCVFCRSVPRIYDSTDRVLLWEWAQSSWGFNCRVLTSGQWKRNNLHCEDSLPGNVQWRHCRGIAIVVPEYWPQVMANILV
jgi:hypothetical protein